MARSGAGFAGVTVPVALLLLVFKNIARDRSSGKSGGSSGQETIKHIRMFHRSLAEPVWTTVSATFSPRSRVAKGEQGSGRGVRAR
jgi:hypothetical protein